MSTFVVCITQKRLSLRTCKRVLCGQKGWDRRGRWGHPQGDMHKVAVVAGCRNALVGTGWFNARLGCRNRLRRHYSHTVGVSFLAVKVI